MKLVYATTNENKKKVLQKEFENLNIEVLSLKDIGFKDEIIEDGTTFLENARIKAQTIYDFCKRKHLDDLCILGDDSGLCIDALDNKPGIYTARYANNQQAFVDNILFELKDVPKEKRSASAICDLVFITNNGKEYVSEGICKGTIVEEADELNGFLFDPIFKPDYSNVTFSRIKDREDHRTRAFNQLKSILKELN